MKVVNILKDGTVVSDMSTVTVPKNVVRDVREIANRKVEIIRRKNGNGNNNTSRTVNAK